MTTKKWIKIYNACLQTLHQSWWRSRCRRGRGLMKLANVRARQEIEVWLKFFQWSINWWKFIDVTYHPEKCERIVVYHTPFFFFTHNYSLFHMKHNLISKLIKQANKHFQMPSMFSKTSFDCKFSLKNNSIIVCLNMCIERTHLNVVLADRSP